MLYLYQKYTDAITGETIAIWEGERKRFDYTHYKSFCDICLWAGDGGYSVDHGDYCEWYLIYVGY